MFPTILQTAWDFAPAGGRGTCLCFQTTVLEVDLDENGIGRNRCEHGLVLFRLPVPDGEVQLEALQQGQEPLRIANRLLVLRLQSLAMASLAL